MTAAASPVAHGLEEPAHGRGPKAEGGDLDIGAPEPRGNEARAAHPSAPTAGLRSTPRPSTSTSITSPG